MKGPLRVSGSGKRRLWAALGGLILGVAGLGLGTSHGLADQTAYQAAVLADHPLVFYPLGDSSGTVAQDVSGNGNNGTYQGGYTQGVSGPFAGSTGVNLNGTSGQIVVPENPSTVSGSFTVEAWVKSSDTTNYNGIFGTRGPGDFSFDVKLQSGDLIHGDIGTGSGWQNYNASAPFNYVDGGWHLIDFVVEPGSFSIYADGNLVGSAGYGGTILLWDSTHLPVFGSDGIGLSGENFDGSLADAAVYSGALNATQIGNHFAASSVSSGSDGNVTATIGGGSLSISNVGDGSLAATLPAAQATGFLPQADYADTTGSGAGWHATIQATPFQGAKGADISSGFFLDSGNGPALTGINGTNTSIPNGTPPTWVDDASSDILGSTPVEYLVAAANTGMGSYRGADAAVLDLNPSVYAQTYTATITLTILTGP